MRLMIVVLLTLVSTPVAAQHTIDRFPSSSYSGPDPVIMLEETSSPITAAKVMGAFLGTLAGGYFGARAGFLMAGGSANAAGGQAGVLVGATVGAGLGAFLPGDSPPDAVPITFGVAVLGTLAAHSLTGAGIYLPFPALVALPAGGALLGFQLAHTPAEPSKDGQ